MDRNRILVVGDWLVDEHWITGQHRTTTSSRTGDDYSRVLNSPSSNMTSLCGAGMVASILWSARTRTQDEASAPSSALGIDVFGLGLWHPDDTSILEHMLDPAFTNGMTHHRLSTTQPPAGADRHLFVLSEACTDAPFAGTTRVIRIYERQHGQPRLKQRIDWDVPLGKEHLNRLIRKADHIVRQLPAGVTHIVVKDLGKGVVGGELIQSLTRRYRNAKWYVSSKLWRPDWLKNIQPKNIDIYLIPQVAAQLAMNDSKTNVDCWLTPSGAPSKEGLEYLKEHFPFSRVVVLPDNSRVLAFDGDSTGYVQTVTLPSDETHLTQMASVFLPALIAYQLKHPGEKDFGPALRHALAYTEHWRIQDQDRLRLEGWQQVSHAALDADYEQTVRGPQWRTFDWDGVIHNWDDAFRDCGIIETASGNEFHLWRGMTELKGYISCIPEKRKHIQQLLRDGRRFVERPSRERKHLSYVIKDKPGSGKSFLIDRLAATLKMSVLKFNLTQLGGLQDLLACFDKIRSEQERQKDVPLLLFFDELNAKYASDAYYFAGFLEPMDDGSYVQHGIEHRLLPCFWIFAGTEFPRSTGASIKVQDFESRLAREPMNLSGSANAELRRVERVYMGVVAIRNVFQDVTQVSEDVLWLFRNLKDTVGPRDITRLVRNCENVQYSRVGLDQFPDEIGQHMQGDTAELEKRRRLPPRFVTIVDEPLDWWSTHRSLLPEPTTAASRRASSRTTHQRRASVSGAGASAR